MRVLGQYYVQALYSTANPSNRLYCYDFKIVFWFEFTLDGADRASTMHTRESVLEAAFVSKLHRTVKLCASSLHGKYVQSRCATDSAVVQHTANILCGLCMVDEIKIYGNVKPKQRATGTRQSHVAKQAFSSCSKTHLKDWSSCHPARVLFGCHGDHTLRASQRIRDKLASRLPTCHATMDVSGSNMGMQHGEYQNPLRLGNSVHERCGPRRNLP